MTAATADVMRFRLLLLSTEYRDWQLTRCTITVCTLRLCPLQLSRLCALLPHVPMDQVIIESLLLEQLTLSPSPWKKAAAQPAYLTVTVCTDTSKAGATDDLNFSVSYSDLVKLLRNHFTKDTYPSRHIFTAHTLAEKVAQLILFHYDPPLPGKYDSVLVLVTLPDALLHGGKLRAHINRNRQDYLASNHAYTPTSSPSPTVQAGSYNARQDSLSIVDFTISTILGLRDHERLQEQPLIVDIQTWPNFEGIVPEADMAWCGRTLQETVWKVSYTSRFKSR
jgi:FolB domain-containing protein